MTVRVERSLVVINPTVPPGLAHRRATEREQGQWTPAQRAANTCMHCKTPYHSGSGAAWVCEHWHEGRL